MHFVRLFSGQSQEIIVRVPALAESIKEALVAKILKAKGAPVNRDEVLAVLDTEKVTVDVNAPASGIISKVWHNVDAVVKPGEELFTIDAQDGVVSSGPLKQALEKPFEPSAAPSPPPNVELKPTAASAMNQTVSTAHHTPGYRKPMIQFRYGAGRIASVLTDAIRSPAQQVFGQGLRERVYHDDSVSAEQLPAKYRRRQLTKEEIQIIELGGAV
jgi:pyruvate/2-oxoglutarate dehydrogenase complex dihydrolipoamide acyltransferase (E2) component